jgi:hypothetical protein
VRLPKLYRIPVNWSFLLGAIIYQKIAMTGQAVKAKIKAAGVSWEAVAKRFQISPQAFN